MHVLTQNPQAKEQRIHLESETIYFDSLVDFDCKKKKYYESPKTIWKTIV